MQDDRCAALNQAISANQIAKAADCLGAAPDARSLIDQATCNRGMPALAAARSRGMVDLLIGHGATTEQVSRWWAPGFGAQEVLPEIATYLIELGAEISPHAAAAAGLEALLATLLDGDPALVSSPGGDGCHPLHFARTAEIAKLLVERGAELDARDEDHQSTPAQWRIKDSPEVTRFLLDRGAQADIFMAAACGDIGLAAKLIADDPSCTASRIGYNNGKFPGIGYQGRGGTIYQWTLGFNLSPHEVALKNNHRETYQLLFENTPPRHQLLVACTSAKRSLAESIAAEHPKLVDELDAEDQTLLAKFCWETNINIEAVRLMLELGFPTGVPEPNHGYTALHNAAWCGDPGLVRLLIDHGHPLDLRHPEYKATALGFAIHSCTQERRHPDGKFAQVVELLLAAGVPFDEGQYPCGDAGIDAVLMKYR